MHVAHFSEEVGSKDETVESLVVGIHHFVFRSLPSGMTFTDEEDVLTDAELNLLSVVAPNVTLCIIKDFEVVEKKRVTLPQTIAGIVKCANPKCITNNEPMPTRFVVSQEDPIMLRCEYCKKEQSLEKVKLV